jgi:ABC-type antimicrobial peptide transport system permease subunit
VEQADARVTVRVLVHNALVQERLIASVAGLFGGLALLIAVVGLHAVTAYTVSRQRREIGVRLALGATPRGVMCLVLGRVAVLVLLGVCAGGALSLWAGRAVRVLLHGLEPNDPVTIGAAAVLMLMGAWRAPSPPGGPAVPTPAISLRN